mmetsp:Transcript_30424/g.78730  ORF Transcript_30424/g.78730 Transcript_30424/m.78730 type:complete len:235 (+) Transcript_30424:5393-6097(+)
MWLCVWFSCLSPFCQTRKRKKKQRSSRSHDLGKVRRRQRSLGEDDTVVRSPKDMSVPHGLGDVDVDIHRRRGSCHLAVGPSFLCGKVNVISLHPIEAFGDNVIDVIRVGGVNTNRELFRRSEAVQVGFFFETPDRVSLIGPNVPVFDGVPLLLVFPDDAVNVLPEHPVQFRKEQQRVDSHVPFLCDGKLVLVRTVSQNVTQELAHTHILFGGFGTSLGRRGSGGRHMERAVAGG